MQGAGEFAVRLKRGEEVRSVRVTGADSVAQLKQTASPEHACRLIHAGREMQDSQRLSAYGLREGSVVHVVMRLARASQPEARGVQQQEQVDGCTMLTVLFTVVVLLLWMIAVSIPEYFSNFSWAVLGVLSLVDVSVMFSHFKSWRATQPHDPRHMHSD